MSEPAPPEVIRALVDDVCPSRQLAPIYPTTRTIAELAYAQTGSIAAVMDTASITYRQAKRVVQGMAA